MPTPRPIIIAGSFPPPVGGMAKNNEIIAADLDRLTRVVKVDLSIGEWSRSLSYHLRRLLRAAAGCATIARQPRRDRALLYIAADGGWGLIYTLALVATARLAGHDVWVHHRSFAAIDKYSRRMRLLVTIAGPRAHHVFLCHSMQRRFRARYPQVRHSLVSSNARHTAPQASPAEVASGFVRIGLLSNLGRDKGLYAFLDVMRACVARGLPVRGVLAGPPDSAEERDAIAAAQAELGERLTYLGPLFGADKAKFYEAIDVFVFPTTFVNEAQPNVVFEAMSFGRAVISFARGCVSEDMTEDCGLAVPVSADFIAASTARLARWSDDRAALAQAQTASSVRFAELHQLAERQYQDFLRALIAPSAGRA